jgi:hypothetical protein
LKIDRFLLLPKKWLFGTIAFLLFPIGFSPADEREVRENSAQTESTAESISSLVERLGSESHAQRRAAFSQILRVGQSAQSEIDLAVDSSDRQIAESAKQLQVLLRVVAKCGDPQIALDVADIFLEADEQNLSKLAERGLWQLAELFLDEHSSLEVRCQKEFYQDMLVWYLIQKLIDHAEQQGNAELAWPVVSRLAPIELVCWTANKLQLPMPREPADEYEQAVRLFYEGKIDEALDRKISNQLKYRFAARGFRWKQFESSDIRDALIGVQKNPGTLAASAFIAETVGDRPKSESLWRQAFEVDDDVASFTEQETEAAYKALLRSAPINQSANTDEPTGQKPAEFYQLMIALLLSGRTEPVERYLLQESPQAAFAFSGREDYSQAFQILGLDPELKNFDQWLAKQKSLAKERLANFDRTEGNLSLLAPALNLGQVGSILASVGKREQAQKILIELIQLARRYKSQEADVLNRCVLRWLGRDRWRELCIDVISAQFENFQKEQKQQILEKLFPHLGTVALPMLLECPECKESLKNPSWPKAFEQLVHLERCDRDFFGPSANTVVRSWILRVAQQFNKQPAEEEDYSYMAGSSLVGLAKLANDWDDTSTALELLGINKGTAIRDFDAYLLAAQICLKTKQFDTALQLISAVPASSRDQHWNHIVRMESMLSSGRIDLAEKQMRSHWMRMPAVNWNSDPSAGYRVMDDLMDEKRWEDALEYGERGFVIERNLNYTTFWQTRQYAMTLEELNQHSRSADVLRSSFLELMRPSSIVVRIMAASNDLDMVRYFAGSERTSRAVVLIEKGDFDGARHELDIAYRLNSHDVEPVINTYTRLVKLGKNELADEVFAPFESALKKQIQSWPEDAMTLNNLAWMYAKCDIKLNEALELSTKSTSLVPNSAVYLDTLAEVHYRRGEVDAAISTMRECVKLDPRAKGYRKNLVRFSSGKE